MTIDVYTLENCPYCVKAKRLLKSLGHDYSEHDISSSFDETCQMLMDKFGLANVSTAPQIIINGHYVGGYDDLEKLLKSGKIKELI